MRLQKYMAQCGVASRRKSEELISQGFVSVNNIVEITLGTKIDPKKDIVKVKGKRIQLEKNNIYIVLNKPIGIVSSVKDEKGRNVVGDLIEDVDERIYPVGRLDIDTTGLVLLTNDGETAYKLTHPKNKIQKKYIAIVDGVPNKIELERLRNGIRLDGRMTAKAIVKMVKNFGEDSILEVTITEGRNRQIKRMFETINHPVKKLKRVSLGKIELRGLEIGNWRYLDEEEIQYLDSLD